MHTIRQAIADHKPNLAINIHSFSECTFDYIKFWLELLAENKVSYLMIAPNNYNNNGGRKLISLERDLSHTDYERLLESFGYCLIAKLPKYLSPIVQHQGVSPTYYYLYELI